MESTLKTTSPKSLDTLNWAKDEEIVKQFLDPSKEAIMMSVKLQKWNKYHYKQERNFVISNINIYNFSKKKLKRVMNIENLAGMTKNTQKDSQEFVLHVIHEPDYWVSCDMRDDFFHMIKMAYVTIKRNNLKIFGISKSKNLSDFVTTEKDVQKGNTRIPLALARLYHEDIMSDDEVLKVQTEMQLQGLKIETDTTEQCIFNNDGDVIMDNIEHKQQAMKRKSSYYRSNKKELPSPTSNTTQTIYSRDQKPGDTDDVSKFVFDDFKILKLIGRGTFGKVYLVQNQKNNQIYAMKSIRKDVVIDHDSLESLKVEKLILIQVKHPFIISMDHVFAKSLRIYFIMQFVQGGELFKHLSEQRRFGEVRTKFYAAQIALALGYLHKSNIYYRDLKPENILLGLDGYILLADFGLAKINQSDNGAEPNSFCGTPEYISPEMIVGSGHDHTLDWWALGVLIYEMIIGIPPFYHKNQNQMYLLIQQAPLKWPDPERHKISVSDEAKDIITMLLQKDRKKRLGQKNDVDEILGHKFFEGIDLKALIERKLTAEFIPKLDDKEFSTINFDSDITDQKPDETVFTEDQIAKIKNHEENFKDFDFSEKNENMGVRNHPYWHIIVQGEKKNLAGKYIERVGLWMPRKTKTIKRGIVLNKHKIRYWLSVGAQPTKGVVRLLNQFDFYPKNPVPWGKETLYEKPDKVYQIEGWKDHFTSHHNKTWKYRQMMQEQINVVERQRRIQAEAMASLGEGQQDLELIKTDDIESEEADIFQRVEKFNELNKRFQKHRKEQWQLKGNDLRYNIYLKKMQKLTRMELGLDVEGYKDYVNNLKEFAKYDKDWEILAEDNAKPHYGTMHSPYSEHSQAELSRPGGYVNQKDIEQMRLEAKNEANTKQLKNTVLKLFRDHYSRLLQKDVDIVEQFEKDPRSFLDNSADLSVEIKRLYDKRIIQVKERNQMNTYHIAQVTDKDLERCGVSKREFDIIKKLMKLDNQMFAVKEFKLSSPYTYTVDLSKYENMQIPQDCKEILFRPSKMRVLYERYWSIASELDKKAATDKLEFNKLRWNSRYLAKGDDEFVLMDKIVQIIDKLVEDESKEMNKMKIDKKKFSQEAEKEAKRIAQSPRKAFFNSGFQVHADEIMNQVKEKGFCTKSQLEYLVLFNEIEGIEKPYHLSKETVEQTVFYEDQKDDRFFNKDKDSQDHSQKRMLSQLNTNVLPKQLKDKFDLLKNANLGFQEKSELLSWFVDSMRVMVINTMEEKEILQSMDEKQKLDLIEELNDLHTKCADQLFEMHNQNAKGELVQQNDYLKNLFKEIEDFRDKIDVVQIEKNQLDMIKYHNKKVDVFSKKISENQGKVTVMQGNEIEKQNQDRLMEQFKNIDMMEPEDAFELVEKLNMRYDQYDKSFKETVNELEMEYYERAYTATRHGLNYSKLYHGLDGGYSMEKLKKVLERIKSDVKDNLHPFIDPEQDNRVESQLKKILKLRIDSKPEGEEAAPEEPEEGVPKTAEQHLLAEIEEEEDKAITRELLKMVREKQEKEMAQDLEDGDYDYEGDDLNDADIDEIQRLYMEEKGYHLNEIEDEEEFTTAWLEWVKDKVNLKKKKRTPSYLDKKIEELKLKRPELGPMLEELRGQDYSESLVGGEWIPDLKNFHLEMDRVEGNIGRYPVGFRHYENWQNYTMKYPGKTLDEYMVDLNSQISFEEFFLLHKKAFLYECQYNPELIAQFDLDEIDQDDEEDMERMPEYIIETEEFYQDTKKTYATKVHDKLLNKEWFKKVDAFEMFTNFWSYGRGLHAMPTHNIYVPVTQTIMPKPKFRDYNKEDQVGEDFTYRTRESHTHDRAKIAPSTLKPSPFSPALPSDAIARSELAYDLYEDPRKPFNKDRRLSKSKQYSHRSINIPMKWRFSTTVGLSEKAEEQAIQNFKLTQGLSMTIDKSPYSLWGTFASIIFKQ